MTTCCNKPEKSASSVCVAGEGLMHRVFIKLRLYIGRQKHELKQDRRGLSALAAVKEQIQLKGLGLRMCLWSVVSPAHVL